MAKKPTPKKSPAPKATSGTAPEFTTALAALLKKRKIPVPKGLLDAPPVAYAAQDASLVEQLAEVSDAQLKQFAQKIAGYAKRQQERARATWDSSPLILELRKRKLKEPPPPVRVVGASASLRKPLEKWSDAEITRAATEWSKLAQ